MKITLKQLKIFIDAARHRSMTIAADKNLITQPAASKAILALEQSLNIILFDRTIKGSLILTNAGKDLFIKAINILESTNKLQIPSSIKDNNLSGEISIAASLNISDYVLPKILAEFQELYPNIKIDFTRASSPEVINLIGDSMFDIGLIEGLSYDERTKITFWRKDLLIHIASKKHPLAKKDNLIFQDILKEKWIIWNEEKGSRNVIFDDCYKDLVYGFFAYGGKTIGKKTLFEEICYTKDSRLISGKDFTVASISIDSAEAQKNYVANSSALACIPKSAMNDDLRDDLIVLDILGLEISRNFNIIENKHKNSSNLSKIFIDFLLKRKN